jgi:HK97 family phage major capsid protein
MKKSVELKQTRASKLEAQKRIIDAAKAENRDFTAEENTQLSSLDTEVEALDGQIVQSEINEAREMRIAQISAKPVSHELGNGEQRENEKMKARFSIHKVVRAGMQNGAPLSGVELEFHQEASKRAAAAGVAIQGFAIPLAEKRADGQTVTQDSTNYGGKLVATEVTDPIEFLRPQPVLEALGARYLTGLQGNVQFPTNDGGIVASWETEVANVANTKIAYGSKTMSPKRLAVSVPISLQNILQSSVALESYTMAEMMAEVALKIDQAGIVGTGSINGILNVAGTTAVVGGTNGAAPTWDNIIDLETGVYVQNANSAQLAYLFNAVTRGKLKRTKHTAGDFNYLMTPENMVNGYKVGMSNNVPSNLVKGTSGAICSAGIFGDFSQLIIGQWGFMDLSVDEVSRKREGYVEITLNTFLDILVRQPKAFSVVKDWLTA